MNTPTTCPVCGFVQTEKDLDTCSQCDADLVCFRLLDTLSTPSQASESEHHHPPLPEHADDEAPGSWELGKGASGKKGAGKTVRKTWLLMIPALVLLMALVTGYAAHRFKTLTAAVQTLTDGLQKTRARGETLHRQMANITQFSQNAQDTLTQLNSRVEKAVEHLENRQLENRQLENRIESAKKEKEQTNKSMVLNGIKATDLKDSKTGPTAPVNIPPETIPPAANPCLKTYQATDTDTLWTISQDLYGSGKYYPVLMAYNPNLDIFNLSSRHRIVHPCDKTTAAGIYRRITAVKHNRWFWKYHVRVGDTPQSIAKRFCSNQNRLLCGYSPL